MSRVSLPYEKAAAHGSGSFAKGYLERREVEKGVLHKSGVSRLAAAFVFSEYRRFLNCR